MNIEPNGEGQEKQRDFREEILIAVTTLTQQQKTTVETVNKLMSKVEGFAERLFKLENFQQVGMTEKQIKQADTNDRQARYALYIAVGALISQWFPTAISSLIKVLTQP